MDGYWPTSALVEQLVRVQPGAPSRMETVPVEQVSLSQSMNLKEVSVES